MKHAFKKIIAMLLVVMMIAGILPSVFAADYVDGQFKDVAATDWFAPYVEYVFENGLMQGTEEDEFSPNRICTRAQGILVLYRMSGETAVTESTFTDLEADWYKNAVAWGEYKEIVNGVAPGIFRPNGELTRAQLVTMVWRYAGEPKVKEDHISAFPDAKDVPNWATDAFNWAISLGIIGGSDGKLIPHNPATRAQYAKIISVFHQSQQPLPPCEEHTWDEGKVVKAATCTEDGEMLYTCTRCGATKTEVIPATGHNYVDGVCSGCGDKLADKDEIVIYYTNDVHTYIDGALSYDNLADLKAQTASVAAGVLLLDAGDHVQGTAYGSMDKGKTIIELMSAAGYDAATLGNHEFDYGMERALELIGMADYPYLSANFYHEKDGVKGDNVLNAYKIFEVGGKKIAVVGITTPESFTKSTPKYFQDEAGNYIYGIAGGADGSELYASVQTAVDAARAAGADYVIALGHCGDDPASKPWTSEEVIANTTGIDAFIDGHSHSTNPMKEVKAKDGETVVLTQTGSYFGAIGRMSITADGIKAELIEAYNGSDKDVAEIKDAWIAEIDAKLGEVIGHTALTFDNFDRTDAEHPIRLVRKQETNTGDFAADALYYLFDNMDLDVDLAIMNGGGVRNNAITGDISYKTCKDIHTFGNVACLIQVTGQQILDALEWGARDAGAAECGGFLQVSGVTYEIHTYIPNTVQKDDKGVWTAGPTGEYRVKNVKIGGEPLDLNKTYNMAGYNYTLRDCGDGFAMFQGATNVLDYVMEDYMVLANYVTSFPEKDGKHEIEATNSVLGANYAEVTGEGRITIVPEKGETKDEYVLASELKDGDEVIIVCAAANKALSTEYNGYYNKATDVAPADGVITTDDTTIVWTVGKEGDFYTFSYNGQKIAMGTGFTSMPLGEVNYKWQLQNAATEGAFYLANLDREAGKEYRMQYQEAKGTWSAYHTIADGAEGAFALNFYVKGSEAPHVHTWDAGKVTTEATCTEKGVKTYTCTECGETKTEEIPALGHIDENNDNVCDRCGADLGTATGDEYVLAASIKDGDKVVIYNPGYEKALTGTVLAKYYLVGSDTKPTDGKYVNPTSDLVWDVKAVEGGYELSNNGNKLSMGADGYHSIPMNDVNATWAISAATTEGCVYITNTGRNEMLEWYADRNEFSAIGYRDTNESAFAMQLYVLGASGETPHVHTWDEGTVTTEATCTEAGVKTFTCTECGETKTEEIPALGHIDENSDNVCDRCGADLGTATSDEYVLVSELKDGDKVVIVNKAGVVAVRAEVQNSYYVASSAVTIANERIADPDAAIVWEVTKNADGTYGFTNGENVLSMGVSDTHVNLLVVAAEGTYNDWTVETAGEGFAMKTAVPAGSYGDYYLDFNSQYGSFQTRGSSATPTEDRFVLQFYVKGAEAVEPEPCEHTNTEIRDAKDATCTEAGYTGDTYCTDCGAKVETGTAIAALGHIDENADDKCDRCGADLGTVVPTGAKYVKVTADATDYSGTYLVVYENGDGTAKVFNGVDKEGNYITVDVTDSTIASVDDTNALQVVFEKMDGGYSVKFGENYLSGQSGKNSIVIGTTPVANTIKVAAGGAVTILSNETSLRFNTATTNGNRFRYYKTSTTTNIAMPVLYKLVEE